MSRARCGTVSKKRHKKVLDRAKGYRGRSKNCYRIAKGRSEKGLQYAYRDRRNRKRVFRALWIQRINAAVRENGLVYSQFMRGLKLADINLNRKMLSEIAIQYPEEFKTIIEKAKEQLEKIAA